MRRAWTMVGLFGILLASAGCCSYTGTCKMAHKPSRNGVSRLAFRGFEDCYRLSNGTVDVVLVPESGGRVLCYGLDGKNILYADPQADAGRRAPAARVFQDGGRFDIGPEKHPHTPIPPRPLLWRGPWTATIGGPRTVVLTSVKCPATRVQITRAFTLAADSSHLLVRQTMTNVSDAPTEWCFWSRTLAAGGGTCVVPLNRASTFPKGYARYLWGGKPIETAEPEEPRLRTVDGMLVLRAVGESSLKVGLDSSDGWMAYACDGLLFAKRFRYVPGGVYNDALGFSAAIYLNEKMCELEPISPRAVLGPGESYTFDEEWWLFDYPITPDTSPDPSAIRRYVAQHTLPGRH